MREAAQKRGKGRPSTRDDRWYALVVLGQLVAAAIAESDEEAERRKRKQMLRATPRRVLAVETRLGEGTINNALTEAKRRGLIGQSRFTGDRLRRPTEKGWAAMAPLPDACGWLVGAQDLSGQPDRVLRESLRLIAGELRPG
jgi:hypothetical protein